MFFSDSHHLSPQEEKTPQQPTHNSPLHPHKNSQKKLQKGLGHLLGIDTHDVGGYGPGFPERSARPGYKSLRTARALEEGMVVTVEPGCYFNEDSIKAALKVCAVVVWWCVCVCVCAWVFWWFVAAGGAWLRVLLLHGPPPIHTHTHSGRPPPAAAIEPFYSFGGVRLEDNVLITADGSHSFTHVPRSVADIEAVMAGKLEWKVEDRSLGA